MSESLPRENVRQANFQIRPFQMRKQAQKWPNEQNEEVLLPQGKKYVKTPDVEILNLKKLNETWFFDWFKT